MTKNEYLDALCIHLASLSPKEKQEILLDFQEHFSAGLAQGKTEDEISKDLGDPQFAAQQYLGEEATAPLPPIPPNQPPFTQAPYNGMPIPPQQIQPQNNTDKTMYTVLLILLIVFVALPGYPVAVSLMFTFFLLAFAGAAVGAAFASVTLGVFVGAIGAILFCVGILLFLGITAALRACVRNLK